MRIMSFVKVLVVTLAFVSAAALPWSVPAASAKAMKPVKLPPGACDLILIVDTYHHIDDRLEYFGRMKDALSPSGRIVVIDFHKRELPVGPPLEHKLSRDFVVDEMKQAGYRLADEKTFLPYSYFLIFAPGTR